jgi:hypothetical protein
MTADLQPRKQRRYNRIEREILRCAAIAEMADFEKEGERPKVRGEFLAELWLGLLPGVKMHPFGIAIRGLTIEGSINLGGARLSSEGRESLVGLVVDSCTFEGDLALNNAQMESLYFSKCDFAGVVSLEGAQIRGLLSISQCRFAAVFSLSNAHIDGKMGATDCTFAQQVTLLHAHIGGNVAFGYCRFQGADGEALNASEMMAPRGLNLSRCYFEMPVVIADAELGWFAAGRCRFRGAIALELSRSRIQGSCSIWRARSRGAIVMPVVQVGGRLDFSRVTISGIPPASYALSLTSVDIRHNTHLDRCRIRGPVNLTLAALQGGIHFENCHIDPAIDLAIEGSHIDAHSILVTNSRVIGRVLLVQAQLRGRLNFTNSSFLSPNYGGRARAFLCGEETMSDGARIDFSNAKLGGKVDFASLHIAGRVEAQDVNIEASLSVWRCYIAGRRDEWSFDASGLTARGIVGFYLSALSSGLALPTADCSELQIEGCSIQHLDKPGWPARGVWASDLAIKRRIHLGGWTTGGCHRGKIVGSVDLAGSTIGESIMVESADLSVAEAELRRGLGLALNVSGCRIGGSLRLSDRGNDSTDWSDSNDSPARIRGCIAVDGAKVEGSVLLHRIEIEAVGRIGRPVSRHESEERVGKRKRGVALSMRGTVVTGHFELGMPTIKGLCDLRDANFDLISDGSGERWIRAGLEPGHLLLDGLVYRDTDDLLDGEEPEALQRPGIAKRRLDWLMLQFPDRKPTADLFVPQPYEQLARIMANEGNERARRQVLVAKRDLQRRYGQLPRFERVVAWILKETSDYGYSPWLAVRSLALFIVLGALVAGWLNMHGAMVLASTDSAPQNRFDALVYALDSALPIIDLGQDSVFTIDVAKVSSWPWTGEIISLAKALYQMIGLILASITVLTLTGTLREKE